MALPGRFTCQRQVPQKPWPKTARSGPGRRPRRQLPLRPLRVTLQDRPNFASLRRRRPPSCGSSSVPKKTSPKPWLTSGGAWKSSLRTDARCLSASSYPGLPDDHRLTRPQQPGRQMAASLELLARRQLARRQLQIPSSRQQPQPPPCGKVLFKVSRRGRAATKGTGNRGKREMGSSSNRGTAKASSSSIRARGISRAKAVDSRVATDGRARRRAVGPGKGVLGRSDRPMF
mmetsp:Transcript_26218/g.46511  ORF Transcript_26218/g.46511 Transcript_26218/m.46511 type:complete len:231 (+) Transcript_26218:769-1461(+)